MPINHMSHTESTDTIKMLGTSVHASHASTYSPVSLAILVEAVHTQLNVLAQQLLVISDSTYTDFTLDQCFGSSIGSHVRHILDHVCNLAHPGAVIDYEARYRGDAIETARERALQRIAELQTSMRTLSNHGEASVRISAIPAPGLAPLTLTSTLERECLYVIDHTVHHLAMIRTLLARAGHVCPSTLGLAAGTPTPSAR